MLAHRLRRWPNIKPTLVHVISGIYQLLSTRRVIIRVDIIYYFIMYGSVHMRITAVIVKWVAI